MLSLSLRAVFSMPKTDLDEIFGLAHERTKAEFRVRVWRLNLRLGDLVEEGNKCAVRAEESGRSARRR